jgi:hypothetical protein
VFFFICDFFSACLLLGWLVVLPTVSYNCLFPHLFKVRSSCWELKPSNSSLFFERVCLVLLFICSNFVFMTSARIVHDAITIRNTSSPPPPFFFFCYFFDPTLDVNTIKDHVTLFESILYPVLIFVFIVLFF